MKRTSISIASIAVLFSVVAGPVRAEDDAAAMTPPRLSVATVDWTAALNSVAAHAAPADTAAPQLAPAPPDTADPVPPLLARLNTALSGRFPHIAVSPVPVLLPFDGAALLRDLDAGGATGDDARYLAGFRAGKFFYPGPAGYDAAFTLTVSEVPEFADMTFAEPIEVQISGSTLLYELDGPQLPPGLPVPELDAEFPGIKRMLHEFHLRYTFVQFGVPYAVSIGCFDGRVARYKMPTCRLADRVAVKFLRALRVAGGTPAPPRTIEPPAIERPEAISSVFRYRAPGRLLAGTGFRDQGGRADHTVYARIRFPLAHAPAYANTQMFQQRNPAPNFGYPWQDNFCERRSFPVGQCPAGIGHQGQDIRPAPCSPEPCRPHDELVAVRDGAILRSPRQEAAYLFVNTATEHLRFRYLHMSPRKMDADGLLSGRVVREGEVIGEISNFSMRENGTSYHLHFDVQVPTRSGWVFVNPYMTLVAAYERLIDGRGTRIEDAVPPASDTPDKVATLEPPPRHAERSNVRTSRFKTSRFKRHRAIRGHRYVERHYRAKFRAHRHKRIGRHRYARR